MAKWTKVMKIVAVVVVVLHLILLKNQIKRENVFLFIIYLICSYYFLFIFQHVLYEFFIYLFISFQIFFIFPFYSTNLKFICYISWSYFKF